jgi:hypothetical protein
MSTENNENENNNTSATNPPDLTYTYAKFNVSSDGRSEEVEIGGEGGAGLETALREYLTSCRETGKRIDPGSAKMGLSLASYPNTLYPTDNEGFGVEDFQPADAAHSFMNVGGGSAVELVHVLVKVAKFWKEHETDFRQFWFDLAIEARRNFLRIVSPQMPESVSDPSFTLNGVTTRVDGAALLMPSITVEVLKQGRTLPDFLQEGIQDTFGDYTRNAIFSLRQIAAESDKVNYDLQKVMDHKNGTRTHYHVFSNKPPYHHEAKVPKEKVRGGKKAVVAWEKENMKTLMDYQMACPDYEFDHVKAIISSQIILLANIVDEYRFKVLKKTDFPKTMAPLLRCLQCGESKGKLLMCNRCKIARYCR